jgi:hypothetical protein
MSKFQDSVAKPRTSSGHKNLLDGGRKDLTKHGQPFNQARPVDKSNAFLAKESSTLTESPLDIHFGDIITPEIREKFNLFLDTKGIDEAMGYLIRTLRIPRMEPRTKEALEEIEEYFYDMGFNESAMSGGAVAGHVGQPKKKKKKEVVEMQSREQIVNELNVRKTISKMLDIQKKRMIRETVSKFNEHFRLRNVVKQLVSESEVEKNPHSNTGINKLEELLKKIVPTLEDSYKTLTSNKQQRTSFRSHILNAIENTLKPEDAKEDADSDEKPEELEEVEINITNSDPLGASDEEKFIDISDSEGGDTEEEEDPLDSFGIEGEDTTGRNAAFEAFKQIENQIIDAYGVLQDPNDRSVFYDYLLTNVKMYFDKFEEELAGVVSEPESDSYEEPTDGEGELPPEEDSPEDTGAPEEEEPPEEKI